MSIPNRLPLILLATFVFSSFLTSFLTGHYLSPSLDEGIYLQGGHRVFAGQVLYRDFFAFAGPLTYWVQAALEFSFGRSIPLLRISTALSVGLITAAILALVHRIAGLRAGVCAAIFYFAMTIDLWNRLEVNHRWLSMGLYSAAAITLFYSDQVTRTRAAAAGALLALAAWTTQSFAWPLLILAIYFVAAQRSNAIAFLVGSAVAAFIPLAVLAAQGALAPMIANLRWIAVNYADANKVAYGYYFAKTPTRYLPHVLMSVWLPPLAAALGLFLILVRKQKELIFPLVFVLAVFPTAYPKWDALQLMFLMGPFVGVVIAMIWKQMPVALESLAQALLLMPSVFLILHIYSMDGEFTPYSARAGSLIGSPENVDAMRQLETIIPAGSRVFVYPYMTALYPILHAENPTRYEYLQPGMMTEQDEQNVLADIESTKPPFLYWHNFPDGEILKIWPNTNPARLHFLRLESYIESHYDPGVENLTSYFTGRVWTRKQ